MLEPAFENLCLKDNNSDNESDSEPNNITNDDNIINSEELVFNPYNPLNKEIQITNIQEILNNYGIFAKPFNLELYKRAFIHRSYTKKPKLENEESNIIIVEKPEDCLPLKTKSNERLEFIGDGVLEFITKYYLYKRFPKADEGFMTEKKIALVKNEHIGKLAFELGLHHHYIISRHAEEKNIRTNLKKLGCLFEAFIGAIFLDYNRIDIKDEYDCLKIYLIVVLDYKWLKFSLNMYLKNMLIGLNLLLMMIITKINYKLLFKKNLNLLQIILNYKTNLKMNLIKFMLWDFTLVLDKIFIMLILIMQLCLKI